MSGRTPAGAPWGWHRLTPDWADRIVAAAEIRPGDLVLDLGAGTGALTTALCAAGADVIAVELHPGRVRQLRAQFEGSDVRVLNADLATLGWPRRPFRVVANPPFAGTTDLLHRLTGAGSRLRQADLVLQRAVVRRWVDSSSHNPRSGSDLAPRRRSGGRARLLGRFEASSPMSLPRRAFVPPPPVDTAVLRLTRRVR